MRHNGIFFGWRVVGAAFVLAVLGWGSAFTGRRSTCRRSKRIGLARSSGLGGRDDTFRSWCSRRGQSADPPPTLWCRQGNKAGAVLLAVGVFAWASAAAPWQLFVATLFSGAGWAAMGGAAVNAIVSPWFVRGRPAALSMAYNGASIGGVVFSPLWVAASAYSLDQAPKSSYSAGLPLGLFAQIGLITHLFSLLAPALDPQPAALATGAVTASAIVGRTIVGWVMHPQSNRRIVACASYAAQIAGSIALVSRGEHESTVAPARGRIVWCRHRQCDVVAAADCPSRISRRNAYSEWLR